MIKFVSPLVLGKAFRDHQSMEIKSSTIKVDF